MKKLNNVIRSKGALYLRWNVKCLLWNDTIVNLMVSIESGVSL